MATQDDVNQLSERMNTKLDGIGTTVTNEAQQIRDFIAANPGSNIDLSSLLAVADRLDAIDTSVGNIFEPPVEESAGAPVEDSQ